MKIKILPFILCTFFTCLGVYADDGVKGSFRSGNITITSYSQSWNDYMCEQLFYELHNNFISSEYDKLSDIYIYPDSPDGLNGEYLDDIEVSGGRYVIGSNAVIKLYNGDRYNNVIKMSPILSHEYGHHYTIVNIMQTEGKYYNNWINSKYGKLRNLSQYKKVCYAKDDKNYSYKWDVTEIAANDYYQLLGSNTGKVSVDYPDVIERLALSQYDCFDPTLYDKIAYNAMPQKNPDIPLAADVKGLYEYMLGIGGYTSQKSDLSKYPKITDIYYTDTEAGREYTAVWSEAQGSEPFEYTLIMYGKGSSLIPVPVKTTKSGEEMKAVFGSTTNDMGTIQKEYSGEYEFVIYTKDSSGFIYAAKPVSYNFTTAKKVTAYVVYPLRDGTLNDVFDAIKRILKKEADKKYDNGNRY